MQLNRRTFTLAGLGIAAAAVTGCKGPSGTPNPTGDKGSTSFTYWSMWKEGEDQQKVIKDALDKFTAETGIKVEVQWSGREVLTQVVPRLSSGNPPDLIDQGAPDIAAALGPVKGTMDLSEVYGMTIPGEQKKVSEVISGALTDMCKDADGKPFLVPYEVIGSQMWFDAKRDPELRAKAPATWEEFMAAMDALKSKGRTPIALDGDIKDYCGYWVAWSIIRAGGKGALVKAAQDASGNGFDDAAWKTATDNIEKLIKGDYLPKGFNGTKFPTQQASWADQTSKTNVILMGSWLPSEATASLTKSGKDPKALEFASFPFPAVGENKGAGVVEAAPIGFAITAKSRQSDAAKKFIAWFMNVERLGKISSEAKNLTPRTDVQAPAELADYAKEFAGAKEFVLFADGVSQAEPKWTTDVWQPALADFFGGKLDAAGFRAQLKAKTIDYHKNK